MQELEKLLQDYTNAAVVAYAIQNLSEGLRNTALQKVEDLKTRILVFNPYLFDPLASEKIENISIGERFTCIKDVTVDGGWIAYLQGRSYFSEMTGCITDEEENHDHSWEPGIVDIYFRKVNP